MLQSGCPLSGEQTAALCEVLAKKVRIYAEGAEKRGKYDEAAWAEEIKNKVLSKYICPEI